MAVDREPCVCGRGTVMPSTQRGGRRGHCSRCQAPRRNRYRGSDAGREVHAGIRTRYQRKLRDETIDAYGGVCVCCGEARKPFLTVDHVLGDGGGRNRQLAGLALWSWLRRHGYPKDRFQLLCFNCNVGRYINGGVCPHDEERLGDVRIAQHIREKGTWP